MLIPCFCSLFNEQETLERIARTQLYDSEFDNRVKSFLKEGVNYPTALAKALDVDFDFNPNDLLGISYIKAALKNNFDIEFENIVKQHTKNKVK